MALLASASAAWAQTQQGGDAGSLDPAKEQPAIMAAAAAASGKFKGYKGQYQLVLTDSKNDTGSSSAGTIHLKSKNGSMMVVLEDNGNLGDAATAHRDIITPGKKLVKLFPETKLGEEHDLSKNKDLDVWRIISKSVASLQSEFTFKVLNVSGRYNHERTAYTNMGGDSRKDFKDPAAGKKPGFDLWTCHRFEITPKNGAWAAQVKKIIILADMNLFCVTRVELDFKGDGSKVSSIGINEIEPEKADDKLFEVGKEFAVTKIEAKKEEKK
jgi:hypothetical protein